MNCYWYVMWKKLFLIRIFINIKKWILNKKNNKIILSARYQDYVPMINLNIKIIRFEIYSRDQYINHQVLWHCRAPLFRCQNVFGSIKIPTLASGNAPISRWPKLITKQCYVRTMIPRLCWNHGSGNSNRKGFHLVLVLWRPSTQ